MPAAVPVVFYPEISERTTPFVEPFLQYGPLEEDKEDFSFCFVAVYTGNCA